MVHLRTLAASPCCSIGARVRARLVWYVRNRSSQSVSVYRIDFDGTRKWYGDIAGGGESVDFDG